MKFNVFGLEMLLISLASQNILLFAMFSFPTVLMSHFIALGYVLML